MGTKKKEAGMNRRKNPNNIWIKKKERKNRDDEETSSEKKSVESPRFPSIKSGARITSRCRRSGLYGDETERH